MNKRPLTQNEKAILDKLLARPFPGSDGLKAQVVNGEAEPTEDKDNYGSIYLHPSSGAAAKVALRVPVEGLVNDVDGNQVNILLHVVDGFI
jgi:hypothetical protein